MSVSGMRVIFVVAGLGAGGAERVISLISANWAASGNDICIIAFDGPDDPVYHPFDPRIHLIRLNLSTTSGRRLAGLMTTLQRWWRLRRILKKQRPDLVVSFLTKVNAITLLATAGLHLPVIVSERNNPTRQSSHPLWRPMLHRLYRRASIVVMQTTASLICLPPNVRKHAVVIPNPIIAASTVKRSHPESPTLVAVGRLLPQKGFDLLIDAFARISPEFPDWRLVIWGEGEARPKLEERIRSLGLENHALLPGLSEVPGGWMERATVFALSSRFEGFPNVLGEAMAAGLPIVSFDCPFGPAEMVQHEVDGLLVPPEDVHGLSMAMRRLMSDPALRERLGAAARLNSGRFDAEHVIGRWRALVNSARIDTSTSPQPPSD